MFGAYRDSASENNATNGAQPADQKVESALRLSASAQTSLFKLKLMGA